MNSVKDAQAEHLDRRIGAGIVRDWTARRFGLLYRLYLEGQFPQHPPRMYPTVNGKE